MVGPGKRDAKGEGGRGEREGRYGQIFGPGRLVGREQ